MQLQTLSHSEASADTTTVISRIAEGAILLVEDDPEIRSVLTECLESQGYDVVAVGDVPAATALVGSGLRPPVVVTDINLGPGPSGLDLADELHRLWAQQIPIVFITGRLDMLRDRGLKTGEHVVPKPFPLSALLKVVRQCLSAPHQKEH